jgi:glycosyltransferase involved in cell wall biosynthesis
VRVLLDATAVPADRRGVGRYLDGLIPALVEHGVDLVVACQPHDRAGFAATGAAVASPGGRWTGRRPTRLLWEQIGLPALIRRVRPDVVHSPHYTMPVRVGVPVVVTLHDATFFTRPDLHGRVKGPFFRAATRLAVRRAAALVAVSQASADEFARLLAVAPDRLVVAHLGVDLDRFAPPAAAAVTELRAAVGIGDGPYVAFLGTMEPRKNIPNLVAGYAAAARTRNVVLVLAGGGGWDTTLDDAVDAARAAGPHVRVLRPGYLPIAQLPALLGGAAVVAFPSLDEGFGLPVLEAMACGAPVLTTRRGALPEVGGDAVAYTEVDATAIGSALGALLDDAARRDRLAAAGPLRAAGFSWAACAQAHLRAYEAAAGAAA